MPQSNMNYSRWECFRRHLSDDMNITVTPCVLCGDELTTLQHYEEVSRTKNLKKRQSLIKLCRICKFVSKVLDVLNFADRSLSLRWENFVLIYNIVTKVPSFCWWKIEKKYEHHIIREGDELAQLQEFVTSTSYKVVVLCFPCPPPVSPLSKRYWSGRGT